MRFCERHDPVLRNRPWQHRRQNRYDASPCWWSRRGRLDAGSCGGVGDWVREHREWELFYDPRGPGNLLPPWFANWQGDGVIARLENRAMVDAVTKKGIPVVDVRGPSTAHRFPVVHTDDRRVAQIAVEHFLDRGFRQFAFCGYPGVNYSDRRCREFLRAVDDLGYPSHVYVSRDEDRTTGTRGI